ncbi:MAG: tRNA modification GTPase [Deltaproteobacteria bacterium]|nr:MAG: tRNA modification GTPase [Deltaproteobacteria bacterium]
MDHGELPVLVAPATAWGAGALAVVRLSGTDLSSVLRGFLRPHRGWPVPAARPRRVDVFDGQGTFDDGVLLCASRSHSLTGEPSAELTVHGNPMIVERTVQAALACGARYAEPGAFTRRAVLAGRMDLVQAEAVLQVAQARSAAGLRLARAGLEGRLSERFATFREDLVSVGSGLEAAIDHPEAGLEQDPLAGIADRLAALADRCRALIAGQRSGRVLLEGLKVALVGPVNAGKSSLFNALLGEERALVHERAGTTRDVVEARTVVDGLPLTLLDTAGERVSTDPIEQAGLALAQRMTDQVDALLVVLRARPGGLDPIEATILARTADRPRVLLYNGVDRPGCPPPPPGALPTVALTGQGVAAIVPRLREVLALNEPVGAEPMIVSARQRDLLQVVERACTEASEALELAGPVVAAELVIEALEALDGLTGIATRESVLDALFSRFCIGK